MNSKLNSRADQKHAASLALTEHMCVCVFSLNTVIQMLAKSHLSETETASHVCECVWLTV